MDKTITVTLKERNFITAVLDMLAIHEGFTLDDFDAFNYSTKDIAKLRDKILYGNEC